MPLVIQLTDDEKTLWRNLDQAEARRLAREVCFGGGVWEEGRGEGRGRGGLWEEGGGRGAGRKGDQEEANFEPNCLCMLCMPR